MNESGQLKEKGGRPHARLCIADSLTRVATRASDVVDWWPEIATATNTVWLIIPKDHASRQLK